MSLATWIAGWRRPLTLGEAGEREACRLLRRGGFKIVAARWRTRFGEHDIIAVEGRVIVFVEVKTRRSASRGRPAEAIDVRRQGRLIRSATAFLKSRDLLAYPVRFDVIEVIWPHGSRPELRHTRSAFRASGAFHFHR